MKTVHLFLASAAVLFSQGISYAQTPNGIFSETVSKEEMIKKYRENQNWKTTQTALKVETYEEDLKEMPVGSLLTGCKELQSGKWVANWAYVKPKGEGKSVMSIYKLYLKNSGGEDNVTLEKLRKKYGTTEADRFGEYANSVPARWINGTHGYIKHPKAYWGYWVSDEAGWFDYKDGETVGGKTMKVGEAYYTSISSSFVRRHHTGNCKFDLYELALQLMSYEATLTLQQQGESLPFGNKDVLLYVDAQGKNSLTCISSETLDGRERKVLQALENKLNEKKSPALPILYTSDGRIMTGHYLKMRVDKKNNCVIEDYLEGSLRGNK